jgi:hypothetical protein
MLVMVTIGRISLQNRVHLVALPYFYELTIQSGKGELQPTPNTACSGQVGTRRVFQAVFNP